MRTSKQTIQTAARLYECQKTARSLLGEEYAEQIQPWRQVISAHMASKGRSLMQAVIDLGQDASDVGLMMLAAAAVEMIEDEERKSPPQ
jgi:hypothetical protein